MTEEQWKILGAKYKVGDIIEGKVLTHEDYGIFLDVNEDSIEGMIRITKFPEEGPTPRSEFPPIGTFVKGILCQLYRGDEYLQLSLKPRHFAFYTQHKDHPPARDPYLGKENIPPQK